MALALVVERVELSPFSTIDDLLPPVVIMLYSFVTHNDI